MGDWILCLIARTLESGFYQDHMLIGVYLTAWEAMYVKHEIDGTFYGTSG
jgi:hypothetical protein